MFSSPFPFSAGVLQKEKAFAFFSGFSLPFDYLALKFAAIHSCAAPAALFKCFQVIVIRTVSHDCGLDRTGMTAFYIISALKL